MALRLAGETEYVHQHQLVVVTQQPASDYQTTSGSFVDIDSTNLSITITTRASKVRLTLQGSLYNTSAGQTMSLDFTVDGTRVGDASFGMLRITANAGSYSMPVQVTAEVSVAAGAHTFRPQWKTPGGTAGFEKLVPVLFSVEEIEV